MIRKVLFVYTSIARSRGTSSGLTIARFPHLTTTTRLHSKHDDHDHHPNHEHSHEHEHEHEHEHDHNHDDSVIVTKQQKSGTSTLPPTTTADVEDPEADMEDMFIEGPAGIEWGGPTRGGKRPEPTRYGDWERKGRATDFK